MLKLTAKLIGKSLLKEGGQENNKWQMITFIVQKQHKKKVEKIAFIAYNDVARCVLNIPLKQRITIKFVPKCKEHNEIWYTNLKATEVEKYVSKKDRMISIQDGENNSVLNQFGAGVDNQLFTKEG